jgi:hypothetical protein
MQVRLSPSARCTRRDDTAESTPPLRALMTLSPPAFSLMSPTAQSMKELIFQVGLHPHISKTKFFSILMPSSVCTTSG